MSVILQEIADFVKNATWRQVLIAATCAYAATPLVFVWYILNNQEFRVQTIEFFARGLEDYDGTIVVPAGTCLTARARNDNVYVFRFVSVNGRTYRIMSRPVGGEPVESTCQILHAITVNAHGT